MGVRPSEGPRRILSIIEGELRPGESVTLFSSAQSAWSGFLLERKEVSAGRAASFFWPLPRVILVASGTITIDFRTPFRDHHFVAGTGSVTIWPGDYEIRSLVWSGDCELLDVEINLIALERLMGDHAAVDVAQLAPQLGISDHQLTRVMRAMESEARARSPAGALYSESLSLALAA